MNARGPRPPHQVWLPKLEVNVEAHRPITVTTACELPLRTGRKLTASEAFRTYRTTWCEICWPELRNAPGLASLSALMTPAEVAAVFRVDAKTVSRWAANGLLPRVLTPGGHNRFHRTEIVRLANRPDETDHTDRDHAGRWHSLPSLGEEAAASGGA